MNRFLSLAAVATAGLVFVSCSDGKSGGVVGTVVAATLQDATRADLSGQQSVFTGTLGSGISFTFPAVKNASYVLRFEGDQAGDEVTFDIAGDDGSALRSKSIASGEEFTYRHENKSQHVIVVCRPQNPFQDDIGVQRITVRGMANYAADRVRVNLIVVGDFDGYGAFNDLKTSADRGAFTDQVMAKVRDLFQQVGIAVSWEGFSYSADQVRARNPNLVLSDGRTVCAAGENVGSSGFELVDSQGLDRWGELGFAENDPSFDRGHAIDVFVVHHFTQRAGTVGLAPRPGLLVGNGPDTAVCVSAFLEQGGTTFTRTPDQVSTVLAHEIGHFLGLLHTTTFNPSPNRPTETVDDGIADTPRCTVKIDANGDGRVGLGDGCPDETNIMFYQAGNQTILTPQQGEVMRQVLSVQEH